MNIKKIVLLIVAITHINSMALCENSEAKDNYIIDYLKKNSEKFAAATLTSLVGYSSYKLIQGYLHYWDYAQKKANTQNLDFILKSPQISNEIHGLIDYLKDPIKNLEKKEFYSHGISLTGDTGPLFIQSLANQLEGRCFCIKTHDFFGQYTINQFGQIVNLRQSAGNVKSFFKHLRRNNHPALVIFQNCESLVHQKIRMHYAKEAAIAQCANEEIDAIIEQLIIEITKIHQENKNFVFAAIVPSGSSLPCKLSPVFSKIINNTYEIGTREKIIELLFKPILMHTNIKPYDLALRTLGLSEEGLLLLRNEIMNSIVLSTEKINTKTASELIDDLIYGKAIPNNANAIINNLTNEPSQESHDLKVTAYHESGHAIAMILFNKIYTLDKVSIVARDQHLGLTRSLPNPNFTYKKQDYLDAICMYMAGYAGEYMLLSRDSILRESSDYEMAYEYACIVKKEINGLNEHEIIEQEYQRAISLLKKNKSKFTALAKALLEHKVLMADEIYKLLEKLK